MDSQNTKLAILKAIKDKHNGEYKYNILPSPELGRRGAVENYLGITFDDDMRHLAGKYFDQLREADLVRSTHSTNRDPENWVKITKAGEAALEAGKVSEPSEGPHEVSTQVHIKFHIPTEPLFDSQLKSAIGQFDLISALFLDLDNFKSINDNYDHELGDQIIREAITTIQAAIKGKGELFHRSGDEMLVLLPNFDTHEAIAVGERIRSAIKATAFSTIGAGVVTATIGVSTYPSSCANWEELKVTADRVAMKAKKEGKDLVAHSQVVNRLGRTPQLECTSRRIVRLPIDEDNVIGTGKFPDELGSSEYDVALARIDYVPEIGKTKLLEVRVQAIIYDLNGNILKPGYDALWLHQNHKSRKFDVGDFDEVVIAVFDERGVWAFEFNQELWASGYGTAGVHTRPVSSLLQGQTFRIKVNLIATSGDETVLTKEYFFTIGLEEGGREHQFGMAGEGGNS